MAVRKMTNIEELSFQSVMVIVGPVSWRAPWGSCHPFSPRTTWKQKLVVQRFPVEEHRSCRGSLKNTKLFPWARNSGEITPPELTGVSRNGVQEKYTFPQLCTSFRRKRTAPRAPASKTRSIHSRGEPLAASWTRINEIWLGGQTYGEESYTFKNMDS